MIDIKFDDAQVKELIKKAKKIAEPQKIQDELTKVSFHIETLAKNNTITDTGRLKNSIHVRSTQTEQLHSYSDDDGNGYTDKLDVMPRPLEVFVGTDVDYAYTIHSRGGVKTNARAGGNGKQFLFRAAEQGKSRLINGLKKVLGEV